MHTPTAFLIIAFLLTTQIHANSTADPLLRSPASSPGNVTPLTDNQDIHEALAFGDQVIYIISSKLAALPDDMMPIGERILADIEDAVHTCENDLRRTGVIWEYKVCCSSQLRYGVNSFAGLSRGSAESAASRPSLFCM